MASRQWRRLPPRCQERLEPRLLAGRDVQAQRALAQRRRFVFLTGIREFDTGERQLTTAIRVFAKSLGDRHPNTMLSRKNLAELYDAWGKPDDAAKVRAKLKKTQ